MASQKELLSEIVKFRQTALPKPFTLAASNLFTSKTNSFFSQILSTAKTLSLVERRDFITPGDIRLALKILNLNPLLLHKDNVLNEGVVLPGKRKASRASHTIQTERLMTASEFEESLRIEKPRAFCLSIHWLAIDGIQPSTPQNSEQSAMAKISRKKIIGGKEVILDFGGEEIRAKVGQLEAELLPKERKRYLERVLKTLFSLDKQTRHKALCCVRTDIGTEALVPFYLQHVSLKISQNAESFFVLMASVDFYAAVLSSENKNISFYLEKIIPQLLFCCLKPNLCGGIYNQFELRDNAAGVLALAAIKFESLDISKRLAISVVNRLFLGKKSLSLSSVYGALTILNFLSFKFESLKLKEAFLKLFSKLAEKTLNSPNPKMGFLALSAGLPFFKKIRLGVKSQISQNGVGARRRTTERLICLVKGVEAVLGEMAFVAESNGIAEVFV